MLGTPGADVTLGASLSVVAAYERFARFYDAVTGDASAQGTRVLESIGRYFPDAGSLLELGCGTGAVLALLDGVDSVSGLDRSPEMLAVAAGKVPRARLVEADMASFSLDRRFDVVICVFDTLNHLLEFEQWRSLFDAVHQHLVDGGLFIFDVNTLGKLRQLSEADPWVHDFDGHVLIMDVQLLDDDLSSWDLRVFEHLDGSQFVLHHESIGELGVALSDIEAALAPRFTILEELDEAGGAATDESIRAYFVVRRRP